MPDHYTGGSCNCQCQEIDRLLALRTEWASKAGALAVTCGDLRGSIEKADRLLGLALYYVGGLTRDDDNEANRLMNDIVEWRKQNREKSS
jgi:hypothetical protein